VSNRLRWLLGLLVSAAALVAALWGIDWGQTLGALQRADFAFLALCAATLLLQLVLRALRWQVLLGEGVGLGRCWSVLNIGYLVNTVLPLRIGEVARAYLISRGRSFGGAHALSSVALERVLDVLSVVLLFGLALPYVHPSDEVLVAGRVTALLGVGGLLAMLIAALWPGLVQRAGDAVIARVFRSAAGRWSQRLAGVLAGLSSLREPRRLIPVVGWTAAVWILAVASIYCGARAFLLAVPVSTAVFVLAALGLGVAVPSSPGQIGVYEGTARYAFMLAGVDAAQGLAIGVIVHAINLLAVVAFGAIALSREGESLGHLAAETTAWMARMQGKDAVPGAEPAGSSPAESARDGRPGLTEGKR
jgi:hypothetical protein